MSESLFINNLTYSEYCEAVEMTIDKIEDDEDWSCVYEVKENKFTGRWRALNETGEFKDVFFPSFWIDDRPPPIPYEDNRGIE